MEVEEEWLVTTTNREVFIFIYIIILLLTIIVNILFLIIFVRHPILVKTSYILHLNLSCAFIALALFTMTFSVATMVTGKWIFPPILCNIVGFFHRTIQMITMLSAFAIINEKFYFRIYHRRHAQLYTTKRVGISLLVYWSISILVGIVPFFPGLGGYEFDEVTGTCYSLSGRVKLLPLVLHAIYIILWCYTGLSLVSLPKLQLPKDLIKSHKPRSIVPELVISGFYFLLSLTLITASVFLHYGIVVSEGSVKSISLLTFYVTPTLIPLLSMVLYTDLKKCGGNLVSKENSNENLYAKFTQSNIPQYPYTAQRVLGAEKKYMSLPAIQECHRRPPLRSVQYSASLRVPPSLQRHPDHVLRSLPRLKQQSIPMVELASKPEPENSTGSFCADPTSVTSTSTVADIVEL